MADSTKFIVEFQAEIKKLKAAMGELKQYQQQARQDTKKDRVQETRFGREKNRDQTKVRKTEEKVRKEERKHVQLMQKEEAKRHKSALFGTQKIYNEQARLIKKNATLEQQIIRQGGGRGGGGRGAAGGRGGQQGRGGSFWGGLGVGVGITNLLGGAWNLLTSGANAGYQKYMEYGQAKSRSIGLMTGKQFRQGMRGSMGGRLGYSRTDTAEMMPLMSRATGEGAPREMQQAMRATGMEAGEVGDVFGTLKRAGYSFDRGKEKQSAGGKEFQKLIAAGMQSGLKKSRFPEFAQGIQQLAEQQRMLTTGNVNVSDIAKQLALWGKSGPGMQGAAGANLFSKVTHAISAPGGGEWGESFMRQAMGFGKPGGTTSFYDAEKRRERAGRDPSVVMDVMKEFGHQFGGFGGKGKEEAGLSMRETLGVTLDQAETLQKIYSSTDSADEKQKQIVKVMEETKPLEEQSLDAMKGLGDTAKRVAELTNRGISAGEKSAKYIEGMQDIEHNILKVLLRVASGIEGIFNTVKEWAQQQSPAETAKNKLSEINKLKEQAAQAKTPEARAALFEQVKALASSTKMNVTQATPYSLQGAKETVGTAFSGLIRGRNPFTESKRTAKEQAALGIEAQKQEEEAAYQAEMANIGAKYMKMSSNDLETTEAPLAMRGKNKKTDSGVTKATAVPTDAAVGKSNGAETNTETGPKAQVDLHVHLPVANASIPTMQGQRPGAPVNSKRSLF